MEPRAWVTPAVKTTSPSRDPKSPDAPESAQSEEEVDELSLIDHNEIMARLTLKQEVSSLQALLLQGLAHDEGGGFKEDAALRCVKQKDPHEALASRGRLDRGPHASCLSWPNTWPTMGTERS